jgi:antimicrobial peptide system SdpA family protein
MSPNQKIGVTVLLSMFFVSVITVIILSSAPLTPMTMSYSKSSTIYKIVPQGFAFFTRDAREPVVLFYEKNNNEYNLLNHSSADPDNMFGLLRSSRRTNIEIAHILSKIKDENWQECPQGKRCNADSVITIVNDFPSATLKGDYVAKMTTPIPWAWSKSKHEIIMKHKLIEISIQ